jgi:hypothetical protein
VRWKDGCEVDVSGASAATSAAAEARVRFEGGCGAHLRLRLGEWL